MRPSEKILDEVIQIRVQNIGKIPNLMNPDSFYENLIFLHHLMKASMHLLEIASIATLGDRGPEDRRLHAYFEKHWKEEQDHDCWLADDLFTAGVKVNDIPISDTARMLIGSIYYQIYWEDPVALLGYQLMAEGTPISLDLVKILEKKYGEKVLRTVRYHAEHDINHAAELKELIDHLSPERQMVVRSAALNSARLFTFAMSRIAAKEGK